MLRVGYLSFLVLLTGLTSSCASVQKDYEFMKDSAYTSKPTLRQSLINPNEALSEASVQKILASKVILPKQITLAIVRLADSSDGLDFQTIDADLAGQFYNKSVWGSRVQAVVPVPQIMIGHPVTLTSLRQAAVLLQADALLVIKPISHSDWKMQFFENDKAKGVTSLEVLLLDTRTSVVPFTSLITEVAEVTKENGDYSTHELMSRAKKASEAKALLQIPSALHQFFAKVL